MSCTCKVFNSYDMPYDESIGDEFGDYDPEDFGDESGDDFGDY